MEIPNLNRAELRWLMDHLRQKIKNGKVSAKMIEDGDTIRMDEVPDILRKVAVMEIILEKLEEAYAKA